MGHMASFAACERGAEEHTVDNVCPSISNLSTSLLTAPPGGSERWDDQMDAQHLPRAWVVEPFLKWGAQVHVKNL